MFSFISNFVSAILTSGNFLREENQFFETEKKNKEAARNLLISHIQSYIFYMERGEHLLWNSQQFQRDKSMIIAYFPKEVLAFETTKNSYEQDCSAWLPQFPITYYVSELWHIHKQISKR